MEQTIRDRVLRRPGFVSFAVSIGRRVEGGNAAGALEMLKDAGFGRDQAWRMIDGWPDHRKFRKRRRDRLRRAWGVHTAGYMTTFVPDFENYDWPSILQRVIRAEVIRRVNKN